MIDYIHYLPNGRLLIGIFLFLAIDLITGITKASFQGVRRTSKGFRQTLIKFTLYGGTILVGMILLNIIYDKTQEVGKEIAYWLGEGMLLIIIYIEVVSILENLEEIAPDSEFVKYFIRPLRRILTFRYKNLFQDEENIIKPS